MTKIGDKSMFLSPISGFHIQKPFRKPSAAIKKTTEYLEVSEKLTIFAVDNIMSILPLAQFDDEEDE